MPNPADRRSGKRKRPQSPEMQRASKRQKLARQALDYAILTVDPAQLTGFLRECRIAYDNAFANVQRISAEERHRRLSDAAFEHAVRRDHDLHQD